MVYVNVKLLTFSLSESQKFQEILKTSFFLHLPLLEVTDSFRDGNMGFLIVFLNITCPVETT